METWTRISLYILLPACVMILGGVFATFRTPGPKMGSALQHFAAGTVFAAVSIELLPEVKVKHDPIATIVGFAIGVMVMLLVKWFTKGKEEQAGMSLIVTVGIDLIIDGLLLGIGFMEGSQQGFLITLALTLELLSLGLATVPTLKQSGMTAGKSVLTMIGLAMLVLLGAGIGMTILAGAKGFVFDAVLAFGVAALLYLVTEELLVEAHEVPETPLTTSVFFAGFLLLLIIDMVTH